jgi:hypothetical protein
VHTNVEALREAEARIATIEARLVEEVGFKIERKGANF